MIMINCPNCDRLMPPEEGTECDDCATLPEPTKRRYRIGVPYIYLPEGPSLDSIEARLAQNARQYILEGYSREEALRILGRRFAAHGCAAGHLDQASSIFNAAYDAAGVQSDA